MYFLCYPKSFMGHLELLRWEDYFLCKQKVNLVFSFFFSFTALLCSLYNIHYYTMKIILKFCLIKFQPLKDIVLTRGAVDRAATP